MFYNQLPGHVNPNQRRYSNKRQAGRQSTNLTSSDKYKSDSSVIAPS